MESVDPEQPANQPPPTSHGPEIRTPIEDSLTRAEFRASQNGIGVGGTVIVEPTNPVDFSVLEPLDRAWIEPFGSAGQLIAAEAPDGAGFVKAFNTNFAGPLLAGQVDGKPLDVFIAGDDESVKEKVRQLVSDGGMRAVDAGKLARARELEAIALLQMQIQGSYGTGFAPALEVIP